MLKIEKYIWWKEMVVGPFSDEQIERLRWDRIEILVDALLEQGVMPKTPAFSQGMMDFPNKPHIFYKQ